MFQCIKNGFLKRLLSSINNFIININLNNLRGLKFALFNDIIRFKINTVGIYKFTYDQNKNCNC